jgi:hypothetical protein
MNPKKQLEIHRLPCGPMAVNIQGVCRRRLKDQYDAMLDKLTQETHPTGVDEDILAMEEQVDIPEPAEAEETEAEKKERMVREGKMKVDVKKEVQKYEEKVFPERAQNSNEQEKEPTREERKKKLIQDGKLSNEVKKEVQKHADRIMPKPTKKTSDHSEQVETEEDKKQGNSKLLQRIDGKMVRWQGKG